MCASVYSSLFLFLLATVTIIAIHGTRMATDGLPLYRQEHGADKGILAGNDFLSVFIGSSLRHDYHETSTEPTTTPGIETTTSWQEDNSDSYIRNTRSTLYLTSPIIPSTSTENENSFYTTTISAQINDELNTKQSDVSDNGVILGVHVSSSIGKTLINKVDHEKYNSIEDTTIREGVTETTTTLQPNDITDQTLVASEEHPSIIAESNKSEFSVEESEPITTNRDLMPSEFSSSYPASVQPLSRNNNRPFHSSSDYVAHELSRDNSKPFHQTLIFHNNPQEPGRARSVSYSAVIQGVPNTNTEKSWDGEKLVQHERHERHYDGTQPAFSNNFNQHNNDNKEKMNSTKIFQSNDNKNYFLTNTDNVKVWNKIPDNNYMSDDSTTSRNKAITSERNWESIEKPYQPPKLPTVYGQPEQNYEVDESASVMTNGRVHGIQPSRPTLPAKQEIKIGESKKTDDNQKVGYVVEGRNYRKYRVEERTSDGFIVGEYGVVSHDDGSLRGVRYTADGTINPRLIYDALMKFLSL